MEQNTYDKDEQEMTIKTITHSFVGHIFPSFTQKESFVDIVLISAPCFTVCVSLLEVFRSDPPHTVNKPGKANHSSGPFCKKTVLVVLINTDYLEILN